MVENLGSHALHRSQRCLFGKSALPPDLYTNRPVWCRVVGSNGVLPVAGQQNNRSVTLASAQSEGFGRHVYPFKRKPVVMARRKVYLSYHHWGEQQVVQELIQKFGEHLDFLTDSSRCDLNGPQDAEDVSRVAREAIEASSVTMVVIGQQTGFRRVVDWELWHTLEMKHGLLAISRPDLDYSHSCLPKRLVDNGDSGYAKWYPCPDSEYTLRLRIEEACEVDKNRIDNARPRMTKNIDV